MNLANVGTICNIRDINCQLSTPVSPHYSLSPSLSLSLRPGARCEATLRQNTHTVCIPLHSLQSLAITNTALHLKAYTFSYLAA